MAYGCKPINYEVGYKNQFVSWQKIKWENILRQRYDYSCGAASLATILQYYFNDTVTKELILYVLVNQLKPIGIKDRKKLVFFIRFKKTTEKL
jgi:predicted double-glycine peptidase